MPISGEKNTWGRVRRSSKRGVFFLNLILRRPHGEGWRESDSENLGHFSLTIYPRPRPRRFSAENFQRGFMFCKSLYNKVFCVKIKNARIRGLAGQRKQKWGGTFRSEIRLLRREFNSPTMAVFMNWKSPFLRPPASNRGAVNENRPVLY